jgi:hypothetical protein
MEALSIQGAEIYFNKSFLAAEEATNLLEILQGKCAWERHKTSFRSAVPGDEVYHATRVRSLANRRKWAHNAAVRLRRMR